MKQGDVVPVTIAGQQVAVATVKEMADGTVTLTFPATKVEFATRTEIAPEVTAPVEESATQVIITGVDQPAPLEPPVDVVSPPAAEVTAPVENPVTAVAPPVDAPVDTGQTF